MKEDQPYLLDGHLLCEELGTGGFGAVWLAVSGQAGAHAMVAVKVLHSQSATKIAAFLDEARIDFSLRHPNIVQVHRFNHSQGRYYISMELLDGKTIHGLNVLAAKSRSHVPFELSAHIIANACNGLHFAHNAIGLDGTPMTIIHRDISADNLMVTFDGHVKLLDFGIAKAAGRIMSTEVAGFKGKAAFASPEQVQRGLGDEIELDARSDIYSMGAVLWRLVTGRPPYPKGLSSIELLTRVAFSGLPDVSTVRSGVPETLVGIVRRATALDREDRYQTAEAFGRDLLEWVRGVKLVTDADVAAYVAAVSGSGRQVRKAQEQKAYKLALTYFPRASSVSAFASGAKPPPPPPPSIAPPPSSTTSESTPRGASSEYNFVDRTVPIDPGTVSDSIIALGAAQAPKKGGSRLLAVLALLSIAIAIMVVGLSSRRARTEDRPSLEPVEQVVVAEPLCAALPLDAVRAPPVVRPPPDPLAAKKPVGAVRPVPKTKPVVTPSAKPARLKVSAKRSSGEASQCEVWLGARRRASCGNYFELPGGSVEVTLRFPDRTRVTRQTTMRVGKDNVFVVQAGRMSLSVMSHESGRLVPHRVWVDDRLEAPAPWNIETWKRKVTVRVKYKDGVSEVQTKRIDAGQTTEFQFRREK